MSEAGLNHQKAGADPRVDLAVTRTELAWERTLLAWMRTTIALTGAGIAFDKGAQLLHQARVLAGTAIVNNGHVVGIMLTGVSALLLMVVTAQYLQHQRALERMKDAPASRIHAAAIGSVLVILLCIAVFLLLVFDNG